MEKSTPHCKLSVVQDMVERGQVRATATAFSGALELGINDLAGMCVTGGGEVYLKLTVIDDVLIVSFKEL